MEFYKIENRFGILGDEKALKAIADDFGAVGMQYNFIEPKEYLKRLLTKGTNARRRKVNHEDNYTWMRAELLDHYAIFKRADGTTFIISCPYESGGLEKKLFDEMDELDELEMTRIDPKYKFRVNGDYCLMIRAKQNTMRGKAE